MKINRMALLLVVVSGIGGCSSAPPPPAQGAPQAAPAEAPRPQYVPPAPRPAPAPPPRASGASWRDLPATPGNWTYTADNTGSTARFGQPGAPPLLVLRCDRARPAVVLQRPGFGSGEVPAAITTSSTQRRLFAAPAGGAAAVQNAAIPFEITLATADPLLDAIAFSRGRFMLEMGGAAPLVLPAWSEIGRVIEDCR
ncbi:MAG: hypothetical protein WCL10_06720 [Novosphingobium sp.]|uniref:hypothetical protein n=1 Tax=Novosphingobium sp. TaxID=1874826 RepID=UPI003016DDA0